MFVQEVLYQNGDILAAVSHRRKAQAGTVEAEVEFASEETCFDFRFEVTCRRGDETCAQCVCRETVFPIREEREQNALASQIQFLNIVEVNTPRGFLGQKPAHGFMYLCEQISRIDRGTINFAELSVTFLRKAVNQPSVGIFACAALTDNQDGDICPSNFGGHGIEGEDGRCDPVDKPLG